VGDIVVFAISQFPIFTKKMLLIWTTNSFHGKPCKTAELYPITQKHI